MRRALRRVRELVRTPADAWLACRMVPWAVALPVLKHVVGLERLARLAWRKPRSRPAPDATTIAALSALLTRRPRGSRGTCYERSLLAYRFLSGAGADPTLVVGAKREAGVVRAHSWVTVGGEPLGEPSLDGFVVLVQYGRHGRREAPEQPEARERLDAR